MEYFYANVKSSLLKSSYASFYGIDTYGDYLIAAVHYSVLTGNSPVGLPSVGRDFMNGENYQDYAGKTKTVLQPVQCRKLQEVAAGELRL